MEKTYDPQRYESEIYQKWEESGAFRPESSPSFAKAMDGDNAKEHTFCIVMPPPNANDPLHIGHAMFVTVEDIMIRYQRMHGKTALWLPGTDHAGIETQFVFEKKLNKEGKSRFDFDRETLYKKIWDYVQENSDVAVNQIKRLGASADWGRFKFTLDSEIVDQVLSCFESLYRDGLVYRGERLVNYCPKCGTGYSELEIEWVERKDPFVYMRYKVISEKSEERSKKSDYPKEFIIGTVRPETKFRDTALAVNPKDPRYKKYIGKSYEIAGLLGPINMTVVADPEVDPKFGTGIMKVTPAHDAHDFELGRKFNLPVTPIIDVTGRMDFSWFLSQKNIPGYYRRRAEKYHGKKSADVRQIMLIDLKEDNLLIKIDDTYTHRVATCYRCHSVLEPLPMPQFFIEVDHPTSAKPSLVNGAVTALDTHETEILGAGRGGILRSWLENLRDWNISRQIVWGIRIPVWYDTTKNPNMTIGFLNRERKLIQGKFSELQKSYPFGDIEKGLQFLRAPKDAEFVVRRTKPGKTYLQETDSFDTWFSSGQWPIITLRTTKPGDFERFYPTSVMETGYDILPFWVMRMMLLGIYLTGKSPFETVYLHGLIRDEKGQKMSKSKGNVINPLTMIEKYGADALRMALVIRSTPGLDKGVGEHDIRAMRNFTNKVWNAARFIRMNSQLAPHDASHSRGLRPRVMESHERGSDAPAEFSQKKIPGSSENAARYDKEFLHRLDSVVKTVTKQLDDYRIGLAAETLYNEFWHWFCDEAIEQSKHGEVSKEALMTGLATFLKLLHPFIPFVTETVWQQLRQQLQLSTIDHQPSTIDSELLITAPWPTPSSKQS